MLAGGGIIACAGMLAAALAPGHPAAVGLPLALAGFAATGLGVANMFPAAMTRAGLAAGPRGVAAASTLGYAGFLLGPPVIGLLASGIGLPAGLTTVSALTLIAAVLAGFAHRLGRGGSRRPRRGRGAMTGGREAALLTIRAQSDRGVTRKSFSAASAW